jgi:hypothetical protein
MADCSTSSIGGILMFMIYSTRRPCKFWMQFPGKYSLDVYHTLAK